MFEVPLTPKKLEAILSSLRTGLEDLLGDQLEAVYLYGSRETWRVDTKFQASPSSLQSIPCTYNFM